MNPQTDSAFIEDALGSGLIDPEDEDCGEGDCGQEGVSASVVSRVDASPILEAGEHVLDPVALLIEQRIIAVLDTVLGMRWDARRDTLPDERLAEASGAVGPIGQQMTGGRQFLKHGGGGSVIVGLAFAQVQQQRASLVVADHL